MDRGPLEKVYVAQLDALCSRLEAYRLSVDEARRGRLLRFAILVSERARDYNLVSRFDLDLLVSKHIGASLAPLLLLEPDTARPWIDIGSGAGLPGLVLKIWWPEQPVVLVESSAKRCLFLEEARRLLGLDAVIWERRIQDMEALDLDRFGWGDGRRDEPDPRSQGDVRPLSRVVLMRAVAPLDRALKWMGNLLGKGDLWLFYGGPGWREALETARPALLTYRLKMECCLEIPWAQGRILFLRKT